MARKPTNKDNTPATEMAGDWFTVSTTNRRPRRRAGLAFTPEGVLVDAAQLSDDQRQAIHDDPFLKITPAEAPEEVQPSQE